MLKRILAALAFSLLASAPLAANPQSDAQVLAGVEALQKGRHAEALDRFDKAVAADSNDAEAHFFRGFALNELKRPAEALEAVEASRKLGGRHPQMPYEKGRAYFRLGRWFEAAREFEQYELWSPGQAATSVYLGRSYLFLGELGKAQTHLDEAVRRDAALAPNLKGLFGVIEQYRVDPKGAREILEAMRREASGLPETPAEEAPVEAVPPPPEEPEEIEPKDLFTATARGEAGYNSNAVIVGVGRELPLGVPQRHASFARGLVGFRYERKVDEATGVQAAGSYTHTEFETFDELRQDDTVVSLGARRTLTRRVAFSFGGSNRYTQVGNKPYWNRVSVRPSVAWWHARSSVAELSFEEARISYFPTVAQVFNRDGTSTFWTLADYWTLDLWPWGDGKLKGRIGATLSDHHTQGDDFDSEGADYWAGITFPLPRDIALDLAYANGRERFDHPNSQADVLGTRRRDALDAYDAQLGVPLIKERLRLSLRYTAIDNNSNVGLYHYNQEIISFGIEYKM